MSKVLILLLLLFCTYIFANPSWLYNIKPTSNHQIIGYGIDKTLSQAKQNAIADIAKTISVQVEAQIEISKMNNSGTYSKNVSTSVNTKTKATLSGVKFLNAEQYNGLWYVASSYDNSPIEIKLRHRISKKLLNEKQNHYLKYTSLFKKLNYETKVTLDYKIIRKDNIWQLKYKDIILPLKQEEFYKLFVNHKNDTISIKSNKNIYNQNDEMYFNINITKKVYVSILYVEHNGKVGVLLLNKLQDKNFTYPNLKNEDTFKISNPYGKTIKELYVALYSYTPIDLNEFENVSENLLDESNYNFHQLIEKLSHTKFSTYTIKIRK